MEIKVEPKTCRNLGIYFAFFHYKDSKFVSYLSSCLSDSSTFDALVPVFCSNGITNFSSEIKVTKVQDCVTVGDIKIGDWCWRRNLVI